MFPFLPVYDKVIEWMTAEMVKRDIFIFTVNTIENKDAKYTYRRNLSKRRIANNFCFYLLKIPKNIIIIMTIIQRKAVLLIKMCWKKIEERNREKLFCG